MFWKKEYDDQADCFSTCFLKQKTIKMINDKESYETKSFIGVSKDQKNGIIDNICPLMPASRRAFYNELMMNNIFLYLFIVSSTECVKFIFISTLRFYCIDPPPLK